MNNLHKLFNPSTVAVIGASNDKGSVGYDLFKNLITSDFQGIVYPVNIKRKSIQGVRAYQKIGDIPEAIDLAVITIPAAFVPGMVEECGQVGVANLVIISAGFQEAGKEGEKMSQEILKTAKKYNMRVLGPNCLGFSRPKLNLNATFCRNMTKPGKIAFISQSGALGTAMLDWSVDKNIAFSHFVSVGSMLDVSFHDLIDYFGRDPETSSILIYMESLTNARKFLSAARAHSRNKPIIVLKVGKSAEGAKAAKSHTGSIAGNDDIYDAAFKRAGIIRVNSISDLFDNAQTLSMQPRPKGNRLTIITNAGGPGVIATDALINKGGQLAELEKGTIAKLDKFLPAAWSKGNPVDVLGDADSERYKKSLELCLNDNNTDGILVILTPQSMTDPEAVAHEIVQLAQKKNKTVLASWMGGNDVSGGVKVLEQGSIPNFKTPEDAVQSFMYMHRYSRNLELLYETPATIPHAFTPKTEANRKLIKEVVGEGRYVLTEVEAKQMLANYGIPVTKNAIVNSVSDAEKMAEKIGFPLVMKISSPDIFHKIDVGGVELNIKNKEEAKRAFNKIMTSVKKLRPNAKIQGVFMEEMTKKRYELLIGCKKDPLFGPAIVFGMGGVAVEIFKDTDIGLPPLNMSLAMRIIEDTKIYRLLKGYRGMPGVDIASIQFLLYKFAYLLADFPEIKELDINPFAVDEKGGMVLDAKVFLDEEVLKSEVVPYSHLVISPYPKEYISKTKLKTGKEILLRPIRPEDEEMHKQFINTFSEETIRQRFLHRMDNFNHEQMTRFTQIDYDREIALVAVMNDKNKEKIIGVVRMINDPDDQAAEITMAIGDPWQHRGLGNIFADKIIKIAKQRELKKVWAKFLIDNQAIRSILTKRDFRITEKGNIASAELLFNNIVKHK